MPEPEETRSPPRVLVIVGDEDVRSAIRAAVAPGLAVAEVADPGTGLERALRELPDLILVDGDRPGLDASELAIRLRGRGVAAPVVALTSDPQKRKRLISAGCDGTVETPFDPARLPEQLRDYLAGKRDRLRTAEERRYLREYASGLVERLEAQVRELERANERLTEIDRFKTEFMQSVSHELSTPLTPIVGYLKILKSKKLGETNEKQDKVLDSMLQSTERLSRVLDNLVDFANLETGRTLIRRGFVMPAELAQANIAEQKAAAKARRVTVSLLDASGGRPLEGDEAKLKQALGNLVDNAVKFSPNGGQVLIELLPDEKGITISVFDQGPGMAAVDQKKSFEPFFHASRATDAEHAPGAGLGLPVARKVAEAHGGRVWVEAPPRRQPDFGDHHFTGSRFALWLPWEAPKAG